MEWAYVYYECTYFNGWGTLCYADSKKDECRYSCAYYLDCIRLLGFKYKAAVEDKTPEKKYEYLLFPSEHKGECDVQMNTPFPGINRTFEALWNEKNKRVITISKPCSEITDSDTPEMQRLYQEKLGIQFYPDKNKDENN